LRVEIPEARAWHILLEYPIPQIGKRIDAVLLAHNTVVVIETKTGVAATSARRQVEDYSISLACFHEASAGRAIVPIVVSNAHASQVFEKSDYQKLIRSCRVAKTTDFGAQLVCACAEVVQRHESAIDPRVWDEALFRPIPPIIDAAVKLYAGMDVFEIGHAAAAREDLQKTTGALVDVVAQARNEGRNAICFVTGVPGAGKTLVGLNAVHHTELKDVSMFLSGNGPLVKIIREALIRDITKREGASRRTAENTIQTFVANVHRFADDHANNEAKPPTRNVIVFDEAQRAWDQEQNSRPLRSGNGMNRPATSEPHMLLDIMNRRSDWAVIIALVGGGQEINRGEAGLSEWGRSLASFPKWHVYASDEVLAGSIRADGFQLFVKPDPHPDRVHPRKDLHLRTNTRSIRAQKISDWVDAVLSGYSGTASDICSELDEMPSITRNINTAREWLDGNRVGLTRSGLVSSAAASRLRADGLEPSYDFHKFYEWEHWFLDRATCEEVGCDHKYCSDVRASSKLEVCATQFEIQGLELDWVGVCWSEDLVWNDGHWCSQKFNNKKWKTLNLEKVAEGSRNKAEIKHRYRVNAYRVLLTRARQGMIIYVPNPPIGDTSRSHALLNDTYDFLLKCGAVPAI
jgi:hypothetical protein